jgi:hypothetical protein
MLWKEGFIRLDKENRLSDIQTKPTHTHIKIYEGRLTKEWVIYPEFFGWFLSLVS